MKPGFFLALAMVPILANCTQDDPRTRQVIHEGEKWNITSVAYTIVDQSLTSPGFKTGTKSNAGAFYFNGTEGSFDIRIYNYHKEDYFGYTVSSSDITITNISQSVSGTRFSQDVIAMAGEYVTTATMTLEGTITKQSNSGQFVMTASFELAKE